MSNLGQKAKRRHKILREVCQMDDTKSLEFWVVGGDGRYPWAVQALQDSGLNIKTWGVPGLEDQADGPQEALAQADIALLPIKPFRGEWMQLGDRELEWALLPRQMKSRATLIAGDFPDEAENWLKSQGIWCGSILENEKYLMENAAVTAEGALYLALELLNRTLWGAEILVIGWGRIGRFLAGKLTALGAKVTVTARRESQWAELESLGFRPEETGRYHQGLEQYDLIVNTVPAAVLTMEQIRQTKPECQLIELASLPGGLPLETEQVRRIRVARGVPGKMFPQTAGQQLAEAVWSVLSREGRDME